MNNSLTKITYETSLGTWCVGRQTKSRTRRSSSL